MLQALLGSAGLTPDDVDDRRVPGLRPGRPRSSRTRSTPRPASPTTSRSSSSSSRRRAVVLHVDDVIAAAGSGPRSPATATLASKRDALCARSSAATLRRDGGDRRRPARGPRRGDRRRAGARRGPRDTQRGDPRRDDRGLADAPDDGRNGLGAIDRDGWQASLDFMTELGLVPNPVTVENLVVEDFVTTP